MFREQTARRCSDHPPTVTSPLRPRLFRGRHWLALLLSCLVAVGGSGLTSTLTLALNARAATAERQSNGDPLVLRKVPGHSPQKTVANFLALTGNAEEVYHAVCYDPLTAACLSLDEIRQMVKAMLRKNKAYLPQFKSIEF